MRYLPSCKRNNIKARKRLNVNSILITYKSGVTERGNELSEVMTDRFIYLGHYSLYLMLQKLRYTACAHVKP